MTISRRRFLKTASYGAAGAGVLAGAALAVTGTDFSLQGIDISHWQGSINWTSVKNSGRKFAFCKATEGIDFIDPWFSTNWPAMKSVGLLRGAYHMGRPAVDATAQADFFFDQVRPGPGDLPLVLDLEKTDNVNATGVRSWVVAFVSRLTARMGRAPLIYTGFYFWRDSAGNGTSLGCPLWLPVWEHDSEGKPKTVNPQDLVPAAWSTYTFWQYSSRGSVPGIGGNVDLDAFNGTKTQLNNLRLT